MHTNRRIIALSHDFNGGILFDPVATAWKLKRDGYGANDSVLVIAWSTVRKGFAFAPNVAIELVPAFLGRLRVVYDILFIFVAPYFALRHHMRDTTIVVTDFPLVWAALMVRIFTGGEVELRLNGLPRVIGKTRGFANRWYHMMNEFLGKHIPDRCIVINDVTRDYLLGIGVSQERIVVRMPDVITPDKAFIERAVRGTARAKLGIPADAPMILSVGRLEAEKAYEELISLFEHVQDDAWLIVIGEGSLRAGLEAQVVASRAASRIRLIGTRPREELWGYYKDADAFVLLSRSEALGLSLMEAMYAEVPVIGRPIGGIKETIGENGLRGFFWDTPDGSEAFAQKIEQCFKKGDEGRAMIARGKKYVESRLTSTLV